MVKTQNIHRFENLSGGLIAIRVVSAAAQHVVAFSVLSEFFVGFRSGLFRVSGLSGDSGSLGAGFWVSVGAV